RWLSSTSPGRLGSIGKPSVNRKESEKGIGADAMHVLELKIPPLALGLVMAALMWLASWAMPAFGLMFPARELFSVSVAIAGIVIIGLGIASFTRAGTTVNPMKPDSASALVVSGIYRLTRNPMYLGFLLVLLGWAMYLSNALAFLFLPAFIIYMTRFQIEPEEKALSSLFGQQFVAYTSRVRRWL
ncbi:MAG: methyltransferase family protein, partial [Terriglobia bacterium]